MIYYNIETNKYVDEQYLYNSGLISDPSAVGIYPVEDIFPAYDSTFYRVEKSNLYLDRVTNTMVQPYYTVPYDTDTIHAALRPSIADARWIKEMQGFTDGSGNFIRTDTDSRTRLATAIISCTHTDPVLFKIDGVFKELTCKDLQDMQIAVSDYVQKCFDWEDAEIKRLNSIESFEELVGFTPSEFNF